MISPHFLNIPINRTEISQARLNIEDKTRSNPLKWNGQFSPQFVEILLDTYAFTGCHIFDPFLGSGTVLLESGRRNLAAQGTEVNPAAFMLSRTYEFINVALNKRRTYLDSLSQKLELKFPLPIFRSPTHRSEDFFDTELQRLLGESNDGLEKRLVETLIVLLDLKGHQLTEQKIDTTWQKIVNHIRKLPYSVEPIEAFNADARSTPVEDNWAELVVTSPPYINVFNYHQQYRTSLEFLNYDLLEVAKSEIGSNRKHRGNRFLTVVQYCLDIALVFQELRRISRSNARWIIVVGRESSVRGTPFYNAQIVTEVVRCVTGYDLLLKQERCFKNRFGQNIFEDILHFRVDKAFEHNLDSSVVRNIARLALEGVYDIAPIEVRSDIQQALQQIDKVMPSPLLDSDAIVVR